MTAIRGARARARSDITAAIKDEARRQLAAEGAAKLSLRAVARELGMASSALYRYFPSRDDLLTALILDAYNAIGEAAEAADPTAPGRPADAERDTAVDDVDALIGRWTAVCAAVRSWALAHPHEYALIYGSPVPGYHAPRATAEPAGRVALALIAVVRDAYASGTLQEPAGPLSDAVAGEARALAAELDIELPAPVTAVLVATWAQLFGLISFELFGQFHRVIEDRDAFFAHTVRRLAAGVGLAPP
ncbi:TetR/AcrR family transcriptional regulator [Streptomyces pinistramenti]|uniref:TetR/AcrR family transcriptional regulator n=1 Tax=Streptomyces pinistramenti TaxID=2884812 RepID=UPI001D092F48|nr:TetR/AcrR family transcriptional regulator [Streptomyces pinistramenti]MCB5909456.1 TetR/AcrR family transcriptional regulator [Streptomyces pinistramenti]